MTDQPLSALDVELSTQGELPVPEKPQGFSTDQVGALVGSLLFALQFMECRRGGAMKKNFPDGHFEIVSWQEDFIQSLRGVGVEIDREALREIREGKRDSQKTLIKPMPHQSAEAGQ